MSGQIRVPYDTCIDAIEDICRGCVNERGWIDMSHEEGECCEGLVLLGMTQYLDKDNGWFVYDEKCRFVCRKHEKGDGVLLEKYKRRLAGDWS